MRLSLITVILTLVVTAACTGASSTPWQSEDELEAIDGQTWIVGTHLVTVSSDASQTAQPALGSTVRVTGRRTPRGELVADSVEVVDTAPPTQAAAAPTPAPGPRAGTQTPAQRTIAPPKPAEKPKPGHADESH